MGMAYQSEPSTIVVATTPATAEAAATDLLDSIEQGQVRLIDLTGESATPAGQSSVSPTFATIAESEQAAKRSETVVYLVSSQEQANDLNNTIAMDAQEDPSGSLRSMMVVDSPEAESDLQTFETELHQSGISDVRIVDMR